MLIINADDWGFNRWSTKQILSCSKNKCITSASAMVFMEYSDRASEIARENNIDTGLHINLTHPFNGKITSAKLFECLNKCSKFLKKSKFNYIVYNPFLYNQFEYLFNSQWDEFLRLYNKYPSYINGHWHMHLCMNILLQKLIPKGYCVRKHFSFMPGEKNVLNRLYRSIINRFLIKRYRTTDYFLSLSPISHDRLNRIVSLSDNYNVELMVHPEKAVEYQYLMSDEYLVLMQSANKGRFTDIRPLYLHE